MGHIWPNLSQLDEPAQTHTEAGATKVVPGLQEWWDKAVEIAKAWVEVGLDALAITPPASSSLLEPHIGWHGHEVPVAAKLVVQLGNLVAGTVGFSHPVGK